MDNTQSTDLSLTWDYQKDLQQTWKEDSAKPWHVYSKDKFTKFYEVRLDFVEHRMK
jgi:hypothetical protein